MRWYALPYCHPSQGQTQGPAANTATAGILKEYDQAIDQIAERAMQSVVEIEVTGYGVPEHDKEQGEQQQALERQRSLGSGVIVDPMDTSSPTITWWPARCVSG